MAVPMCLFAQKPWNNKSEIDVTLAFDLNYFRTFPVFLVVTSATAASGFVQDTQFN